MAQTPCIRVSEGKRVDHEFAADAKAGVVVEVGTIPMIVSSAVDYSEASRGELDVGGLWDIPQAAEIINAGDAVYWDSNGTPVTGDASSGCATATATGNNLLGTAAPLQPNGTTATAATDTYVRVILNAAKRTTTIGGSVTADAITGSDSALAIAGLGAGQGGTVTVTGGASTTATNAGGAVSMTGGTGGATSNGGAASVAGGVPGATSGTGGAASLTGGNTAGAAGTNYTGGAASVTGGTGKGTGNGGAVSVTGGVAGATGAGGAASLVGGAGGATSGTGGAVTVTSGAGTAGDANSGAVTIDSGAKHGSGTAGTMTIGGTNATTINIGNASASVGAAGLWTFAKQFRIPVNASVAVGGNAQANANAVSEGFTVVTGADDTGAIVLPTAVAGAVVIVKSTASGKNLVVFPAASDAINALSANASYNFTSDAGMGMFIAADATTWYSLPLDA